MHHMNSKGFSPTPMMTQRSVTPRAWLANVKKCVTHLYEYRRTASHALGRHHRCRGFSLIELLVVIAVIGLLASVAMASFGLVQRKGRDSRRMSDVQAIHKALASFAVTSGGVFPISTTPITITGNDGFSNMLMNSGAINAVPPDPGSPIQDYTYVSNSSGSTYTISFCLETDSIKGYAQGCGNTLSP